MASLSPAERLIAECVLRDPEKVVTASISELKDSGASVGSIVGFCRFLGFKGFSDFKIALARDLAQSGLSAGHTQQNESLYEAVFQFHAQSLTETLQINSQASFGRAAAAMEKARRIEFFSIGISYPVACTAYCNPLPIGVPTAAQFDSRIQLITAAQLKARDVAFGISCAGTTRETVQRLEVAKGKRATTICLTNAVSSPITTCSDLCLYDTPSEIKYFQAPLASRITQMAVIDALFVSLALKHRIRTAGWLQQSGEQLLKRRLV